MAFPTVTFTLQNNTVSSASDLNTNFTDLINGMSLGTKDLFCNILTIGGIATIKGNVSFGNSSSDDLTINGSLSGNLSTDTSILTIDIGNTTAAIRALYLGNRTTDSSYILLNASSMIVGSSSNALKLEGVTSGLRLLEDGYLRIGVSSDLEFKHSSDNFEIRNRTSNKDILIQCTTDSVTNTMGQVVGETGIAHFKIHADGVYRQAIINGNFDVWQRATSVTNVGTFHVADRFYNIDTLSNTITVSRDTDVPTLAQSGVKSNYSLKVLIGTNTTPAAGEQSRITYNLEGNDAIWFMNKQMTLGFWVKGSTTGTYSVSFLDSNQTRTYVSTYTINAANTWEYKTVTLTFLPGVNFSATSGLGLSISFWLSSGSTYQTSSLNSWIASVGLSDAFSANTQTNLHATAGNTFFLSQVNLNLGQLGLPCLVRGFEKELELCQRYYEKSYSYVTFPGAVNSAGWYYKKRAAQAIRSPAIRFKRRKRAVPTVVNYSTVTGASNKFRVVNTALDTTEAMVAIGETGYTASLTRVSTNEIYAAHYTASAEINI